MLIDNVSKYIDNFDSWIILTHLPNPKQMRYFSTPENIDASFIFNRLEEHEYLDSDLLSPIKLLDYIEQRMMKKDKDE